MILLDGSPNIDPSHQTADPDPRHQAPAPSGACCLRCGGLLVLSYMASLERDLSGRPMRLWRCVNCGDCVDHAILANRWKGPGSTQPARMTTDRASIHRMDPRSGDRHGLMSGSCA